jgi:2-(1,2-epoxy-1,2-dihydrophenyl)acetyl-CoA isomerase
MESLVLASVADGMGRLTFNRPSQRNAMSVEMMNLFHQHLRSMEADPAVRCIVVDGAGSHFMAGGDIKSWERLLYLSGKERGEDFKLRLSEMTPLVELLDSLTKPLVVAVRGFAVGAGLCFVAAADFVLADETAKFLFANIRASLIPDMGLTHFLPRAVGQRQAMRLSLMGGQIGAAEAMRLGLVTDLVGADELESALIKLVSGLVAWPSTALSETKRLIRRGDRVSIGDQFAAECDGMARCAETDDFIEAVKAFSERREPRFH